jgi:alanyl-tRNA synthetase
VSAWATDAVGNVSTPTTRRFTYDTSGPTTTGSSLAVTNKSGAVAVGDTVRLKVDAERRDRIRANHSATHLLHAALRKRLGGHVTQKGSLVAADRFRFDFSHPSALTAQEIADVEADVNAQIRANEAVSTRLMTPDDAIAAGAMALFGEKYGDEVRVLTMGRDAYSVELCGGTHVRATGDIGLFRIVSEGGVAAGIRRVEAVAGTVAIAHAEREREQLARVAETLRAQPAEVELKLGQALENSRALEKELARLMVKMATSQGTDLAGSAVDVKGVKVLAAKLEGADVKTLRETLDQLKGKLKSSAIVLAASEGEKVSLIAGVTQDLIAKVKAGELVNFVASQVGGKGGGRPDMAQAGGTNAAALPKALESVQGWVAERL